MKLREFNREIYDDLIQQAKNCVDHEDVTGCCRVLLPVIEYYCSHYEPLPQEVVTMLMECTYIDDKHIHREREPRIEEMVFSSHGVDGLYF